MKKIYVSGKLIPVIIAGWFLFCVSLAASSATPEDIPLERLTETQIERVQSILSKLDSMIQQKRLSGEIARLTFAELEALLGEEERKFLQWFRTFDPVRAGIRTTWRGIHENVPDLVRVEGQKVRRPNGDEEVLPVQFVPAVVFEAYERMMTAMERKTGRRLLIDSGYRTPAYQLYLFLFYLKNHDYSILETAKWNAFPGYSEHGDPSRQALDFISREGVTGEDNPADFENLIEFHWLIHHADRYGFSLSYPKDSPEGIAFEPWHWHYESSKK